jgi:predicted  nucleic acid-binding Zn-ribbon protein
MLGEHKKECFQAIEDMRETHNLWWNDLGRDRSRRKGERRERILSNLEKNRERYRKTADALQRTRAFVDELRDRIAAAWNDNWAADAERRLSDAEDRIRDMEDSLRQIEDWIEEDERQLNDL